MSKGGKRTGAGRPKGAVNQRTRTFQRNIENSGLTPLEYLLRVMRNSRAPAQRRDWAAAAAAPYIHPRIQAVQSDQEEPNLHEHEDQTDLLDTARKVAFVLYLGNKELQKEKGEASQSNLDKYLEPLITSTDKTT